MSLVIASQLDDGINALLRAHPLAPTMIEVPEDEPWAVADRADAMLVWPSAAWRSAPARPAGWPGRLRWVQAATAGMDYFPAWLIEAPGIACARGVSSAEIADYVMAAIFAVAKPLHRLAPSGPEAWISAPTQTVARRTVGIIGYGSIGRAVARRALGNDMKVVAVRRGRGPTDNPAVHLLPDLRAVFEVADDIVLALPHTSETVGIVNAQLLRSARPGAHLINVGRGSSIDHAALLGALDKGPLGFATLDVTQPEPLPAGHPFYGHPKVRLTPHIASNFGSVRSRLESLIVENLERIVSGLPLKGAVDPAAGY